MMPSISCGVLLEEGGAFFGVFVGFYGAVGGDFGREDDGLDAGGFECGDHLQSAAGGEVRGEESAVAYDYAHCHLSAHDAVLLCRVVRSV